MKRITNKQMIEFARKNNIHVTTKMNKAELEAAITPFLRQQLENKEEKSMQYIKTTPNSMMSIKCAMDMRLPTDDMHTVITTTMQSSIEVYIVAPYMHTDEVVRVDIDMDEALTEAQAWYNTHTAEHALDESDKPTPNRQCVDVFMDLIARKHHLYHTLDTMRVRDPKDAKYPQYAVRDEQGEIMTYTRAGAWADAHRTWDIPMGQFRKQTREVLGLNVSRDGQGNLLSLTIGKARSEDDVAKGMAWLTKRTNQYKGWMKQKQDKAKFDYGKAARITREMMSQQAPLREEIKGINARLDKATELFGYKIWSHYHDAMNVDLNLNFISGIVDETCDDLNAHDASLNRGDDLSKAHQEEMDGKMAVCSWNDREEGQLGSKHRMPFRAWDDEYEAALKAKYITDLDPVITSDEEWDSLNEMEYIEPMDEEMDEEAVLFLMT